MTTRLFLVAVISLKHGFWSKKSLIALLVLIAIVSTMSPNFLPLITCSTFFSKRR